MRTQPLLHNFRRNSLSATFRTEQSVGWSSDKGLVSIPSERADTDRFSRTQASDPITVLKSSAPSVRLKIQDRKLDLLWVVTSIGIAIFTWRYAVRDAYTPIWLYVVLNLQCAVLFALRHPARLTTRDPLEIAVTLLSLNYIFAFQPLALASSAWALVGGVLSTAGGFLTFVSAHCLGRSFAVLPSVRPIQTSGLYRFVRHPIYLSYIITALGIVIRHLSIYNGAVALVGITLILWRIKFEERLLVQEPSYRDYMARVRYRLMPGLY